MVSSRVILGLSAVALVLFAGGISLTGGGIAICTVAAGTAATDICGYSLFVTVLVTSVCVLIGGLAMFATWILGLVRAATLGQWKWFIAILFLTPIATLLYGLRERDRPARMD